MTILRLALLSISSGSAQRYRRVSPSAMHGQTFCAAIPHTCSPLSHSDASASTPTRAVTASGLIALVPMDQCTPKLPTRRSACSSPASIDPSMARSGQHAGMAACNGRAARNFIRMVGCISMRCCPLLPQTSIIWCRVTSGTSGGSANLDEIKSNNLALNATLRSMFLSTLSKAVMSIFQRILVHGFHPSPIIRIARNNNLLRFSNRRAFSRCHT